MDKQDSNRKKKEGKGILGRGTSINKSRGAEDQNMLNMLHLES